MENEKIKLISYNYFDKEILEELSKLGEVTVVKLVGKIMQNIRLQDTILMYLVKRLIL